MDPRLQLVRSDLSFVFGWFDLPSLRFVRDNRDRLIRRRYNAPDGSGCLFGLLSRTSTQRIDSREDLTRFFTGGTGDADREQAVYQPAKWLVRLIDGEKVERYGGLDFIDWDFIVGHLEEVIAQREAIEAESAAAETAALARSKRRAAAE